MTNQTILIKPEEVISLGLCFRQGSNACTTIVEQIKHIIQQLPEGWCGNRATTVLEQTVADMESYQQLIAHTQLFGKSLVQVANAMKAADEGKPASQVEVLLPIDLNGDGLIDDGEMEFARGMDMNGDNDFDGDDYDTIQRQIMGGIGLDVNNDGKFDEKDKQMIIENDFNGDGDYDLEDKANWEALRPQPEPYQHDPARTQALWNDLQKRFDLNGDGEVTQAERAYVIQREDLESRWDQYDYDGDGSRDEDDAILQDYDDNRDGVVNGNDDSVRDSWMDNPAITGSGSTPPTAPPTQSDGDDPVVT